MIELKNIVKVFDSKNGDIHAVNDVSLSIDKGDIYGIIGFSGAGKSTLIRCINLLERATQGEIIVDDKNLMQLSAKELRESRKKMGMIFQHFNLMRSRNVFQNVAFPLKGSGLNKTQIKNKVLELLKLVELSDKEKAYPSQLSGGQKQRVAIARALANDPKVLLCDEATSALDPQTTHSILSLLKSIREKLGLTIVLITHEMGAVKLICNKVAIMENGKVVENGDILSVFSNPIHQVTKNFINSTSSIYKVYELLEENDSIVACDKNESLYQLNYVNDNAQYAFISQISIDYGVKVNIIFGNVEVLENTPIGSLVVKISGSNANVEKSIKYLEEHGVKVEVLKK